jgi:TolB-like protein
MKVRILFVLAMAALARMTAAETPPPALTVAVYDFKGEADAASYGNKVTALVTADLATQTNLMLVERAALNKALNEQAFGISGLVSSDAAAKIGQITGAKVLVCGEVLKTGQDHLVIIATIVGTETGRLFAAKVEGAANNLMELISDLSSKIAATIASQASNLVMDAPETSAARLERIVKSIQGTNRPSVAFDIFWGSNQKKHCNAAEVELGVVLLKAGFPVVDARSERKPDVQIKGVYDHSEGPQRGDLFSYRAVIELRVQERRTGNIIAFDRQEGVATDASNVGADRAAQVLAVDGLAERLLPLLAK